jgi:NAD(P)H-dependent flavin oxidoreductase YrpB (nitropropane dioxygenase family)
MYREGMAMRGALGLSWTQTVMAANSPMLTKASLVDGRIESGIMPTGQAVGLIDDLPTCAELIERIMAEAEATLARLGVNP